MPQRAQREAAAMPEQYVTAQDVADRIGASIDKVYALAQAGEIPTAFRLGPRYRFDLEAVVDALAKKEETSA